MYGMDCSKTPEENGLALKARGFLIAPPNWKKRAGPCPTLWGIREMPNTIPVIANSVPI
jgi:hypothetical protein